MSDWREQNEGFLPYCFDEKRCMVAESKQERIELLRHMNEIVRYINDERAYNWWIMVVPDCASDEDYEDIAEDAELCTDVCELFGKIIHYYIFKEYENKKEDKE